MFKGCPCHSKCPNGCHGCDHWSCENPISESCEFPDKNQNYLKCKDIFVDDLNECIQNCPDNTCLSDCSRNFENNMENWKKLK